MGPKLLPLLLWIIKCGKWVTLFETSANVFVRNLRSLFWRHSLNPDVGLLSLLSSFLFCCSLGFLSPILQPKADTCTSDSRCSRPPLCICLLQIKEDKWTHSFPTEALPVPLRPQNLPTADICFSCILATTHSCHNHLPPLCPEALA